MGIAICEFKDMDSIRIDELIDPLQTFEITISVPKMIGCYIMFDSKKVLKKIYIKENDFSQI